MDFDFNLILVPLTLLFFVIWLLDKLVFKQRKNKGKGNENILISWAYDFWPVLAFVMLVRSFLIEPYNIPSSSMVPTLETGDYILVNKYAFGVRLPLLHTKVLDTGEPKHGDVAVFRYPVQPSIYYIKRIIGLPGDTLAYEDGTLFINGKPVQRKLIQTTDVAEDFQETLGLHQFTTREKLGMESPQLYWGVEKPNGKLEKYETFVYKSLPLVQANAMVGKYWKVTVPEGMYFTMGDNRDNSTDSRFWGFVPESHLSGKAVYVWMHKKPGLNIPEFSKARKIQ